MTNKTIESNGNNSLTKEEAKNLLDKERNGRIEECRNEIQKVLDRFNCIIDVSVILKQNLVSPLINIVSKE